MRTAIWLGLFVSFATMAAPAWKTPDQFEHLLAFKDMGLSQASRKEQVAKDGGHKLIIYTPAGAPAKNLDYQVALKFERAPKGGAMVLLGAILVIPDEAKGGSAKANGDAAARVDLFSAFMELNEFSAAERKDLLEKFQETDKFTLRDAVDGFFDPPGPWGNKRLRISKQIYIAPGPGGYGQPSRAETRVVTVPDP